MNGSTFKRKSRSGTTSWCYSFLKGRDTKTGKRIICFKGGYEKKTDASNAYGAPGMSNAIIEHEKNHGKITKRRGVLGTGDLRLPNPGDKDNNNQLHGSGDRRHCARRSNRAPRRRRAGPGGSHLTFKDSHSLLARRACHPAHRSEDVRKLTVSSASIRSATSATPRSMTSLPRKSSA